MSVNLLIVDDDEAVREALREFFETEDGFSLVGTAASGDEALDLALRCPVNVALMDVRMPGGGADGIRRFVLENPDTLVICLSSYNEASVIMEMKEAGACGFVVKGGELDDLAHAIRKAPSAKGFFTVVPQAHRLVKELSGKGTRVFQVKNPSDGICVEAAIREGKIQTVYQRVVRLEDKVTVGYEALSRFQSGLPLAWFQAAIKQGLRQEFEKAALQRALEGYHAKAGGAYISLNVSAETLLELPIEEMLGEIRPEQVVIEVAENNWAQGGPIWERMANLQKEGFRLALDDVGGETPHLQTLLTYVPNFLKLHMSLIRGIEGDEYRRTFVSGLEAFSREINTQIIAKGVETRGECQALIELRIPYAQGFYF